MRNATSEVTKTTAQQMPSTKYILPLALSRDQNPCFVFLFCLLDITFPSYVGWQSAYAAFLLSVTVLFYTFFRQDASGLRIFT